MCQAIINRGKNEDEEIRIKILAATQITKTMIFLSMIFAIWWKFNTPIFSNKLQWSLLLTEAIP